MLALPFFPPPKELPGFRNPSNAENALLYISFFPDAFCEVEFPLIPFIIAPAPPNLVSPPMLASSASVLLPNPVSKYPGWSQGVEGAACTSANPRLSTSAAATSAKTILFLERKRVSREWHQVPYKANSALVLYVVNRNCGRTIGKTAGGIW